MSFFSRSVITGRYGVCQGEEDLAVEAGKEITSGRASAIGNLKDLLLGKKV